MFSVDVMVGKVVESIPVAAAMLATVVLFMRQAKSEARANGKIINDMSERHRACLDKRDEVFGRAILILTKAITANTKSNDRFSATLSNATVTKRGKS